MNHAMRLYAGRFTMVFLLPLTAYPFANGKPAGRHPVRIAGVPAATLVNINNISAWQRDNGSADNNPATLNAGVTFPRGTATAIYESGLVWGGNVHDSDSQIRRVNGQTYLSGMVPGRIISKGSRENPSDPTVRIYRIRSDYASADLRQDASEFFNKPLNSVTQSDIDSIRNQYSTDWIDWPWQKGAPFYDANHNRARDSGEAPGIGGADQVVWFVMNDLDAAQSQSFEGSHPIGLEVQVTLWAYSNSGQLGNAIFKRYRIIYKGTSSTPPDARIDSMFIAQWCDPDIGDYGDDYAGCDSALGLGFAYNSSNTDAVYQSFGLRPPAMGYVLLQGPLIVSPADTASFDLHRIRGFRNIPMTTFAYIAAAGSDSDPDLSNYSGTNQWYNLLRGFRPRPVDLPQCFRDTSTHQCTHFELSGDPITLTGWIDGRVDLPGDRRILLSSGPFTMAVGDTQEIVVALVGGLGSDQLASISALKGNVGAAQQKFRSLIAPFVVGVRDDLNNRPGSYLLAQNYPNPFNASTRIGYSLAQAAYVKLIVYDVLGREVKTLVNGLEGAGSSSVRFDADQLSSGVYYYRLQARDFVGMKKMLYMR